MLVWKRGFYGDDWNQGDSFINLQTFEWSPSFALSSTRPLLLITHFLVALLWTNELLTRAILTFFVGLNALSLGWLVYRIGKEELSATIAGWLFLVPTVYTDVTLWVSACAYMFVTAIMLVVLHITWSFITTSGKIYAWLPWLILASVAWLMGLLWVEIAVGALVIVPMMAIIRIVQNSKANPKAITLRALLMT